MTREADRCILRGLAKQVARVAALPVQAERRRQRIEHNGLEGLTHKLDDILTLPNLRRVSSSPFADVDRCAERLGDAVILSWKPHLAHLVGNFDGGAIRKYIRHALEVTQREGCVLEMVLKDTHTCEHRSGRFDRRTQIARQEIEQLCS